MKRSAEYDRFWDYALKHYGPRLEKALERIQAHVQANGWECDPVEDLTVEDLEFSFTAAKPPEDVLELAVDFRMSMCLQEDYGDGKGGVTFRLDVTRCGGTCIGGCSPENYGPKCWVPRKNLDEVSERLSILEKLDLNQVLKLIERDQTIRQIETTQ